ncbi:MAG: tryptophan synthase alpha chain [Pirellulaceae bacterium]|jgi:tryptophan synthase alpha chain
MSSIDQLFSKLRSENKKAFMPFVTAGDPNLEFTSAALQRLSNAGCHLCEVGIPYSDPIADGPTIQASYTRALDKKVKLSGILEMLKEATPKMTAPAVTMVSYAIIYRYGLQKYVDDARAAGVAGAIVPDLLLEEAAEFSAICRAADFSLVQLVTPTTPRPRAIAIANTSSGFIYYVSVTGITGERQELPAELLDNVAWLREQTELPVCIGFGISTPEHVKKLAPVADGLIVGSAIVRRIAEAARRDDQEVLDDVEQYAKSLLAVI